MDSVPGTNMFMTDEDPAGGALEVAIDDLSLLATQPGLLFGALLGVRELRRRLRRPCVRAR
jgi:hypothetical protein